MSGTTPDETVVRRSGRGWIVGDEQAPDLTSAMVLAERHRLRPRDAFDLLRNAARTRGRRVIDVAEEVVGSTSNSLLRLPEELERKPEPRAQIRAARRSRPRR